MAFYDQDNPKKNDSDGLDNTVEDNEPIADSEEESGAPVHHQTTTPNINRSLYKKTPVKSKNEFLKKLLSKAGSNKFLLIILGVIAIAIIVLLILMVLFYIFTGGRLKDYTEGNTCDPLLDKTSSGSPVVVIDPGHPGPGAIIEEPVPGHPTIITSTGYNPGETEDNFAVAQILEKKLLEKGYEVIMTKKTVKDRPSLVEIAKRANNAKADIAVSIHYDSSAGGFGEWGEIYAQQNDLYRSNERDTDRVTFKNTEVAKKSQEYSKKIKESRNKYENNKVNITVNDSFNARADKMPGNISFVQLLSDVPWVYNESGGPLSNSDKEKYANGLFEGITKSIPVNNSRTTSGLRFSSKAYAAPSSNKTIETVEELNGYKLPATEGYMGVEETPEALGGKAALALIPPGASKSELDYYIAMRWPYTKWAWNGTNDTLDQKQLDFYLKHPKILVTNTRTKKSIIAVALESGPAPWTGVQGVPPPPDDPDTAIIENGPVPSYWRGYLKNDPPQYKGRVAGLPPKAWKAIDARQLEYTHPKDGDILTFAWVKDQDLPPGPIDGIGEDTEGEQCSDSSIVSGDIVETALNLAWDHPVSGNYGDSDALSKKDAKPEYVRAKDKYNRAPVGTAVYSDCGVFVATTMRASGVDKNYYPRGTGEQLAYLQSHKDIYEEIPNKGNTSNLEPGDIFVYRSGDRGHTMFFVGNQKGGNLRQASLHSQPPNTDGGSIYFSTDGNNYHIFRVKK